MQNLIFHSFSIYKKAGFHFRRLPRPTCHLPSAYPLPNQQPNEPLHTCSFLFFLSSKKFQNFLNSKKLTKKTRNLFPCPLLLHLVFLHCFPTNSSFHKKALPLWINYCHQHHSTGHLPLFSNFFFHFQYSNLGYVYIMYLSPFLSLSLFRFYFVMCILFFFSSFIITT